VCVNVHVAPRKAKTNALNLKSNISPRHVSTKLIVGVTEGVKPGRHKEPENTNEDEDEEGVEVESEDNRKKTRQRKRQHKGSWPSQTLTSVDHTNRRIGDQVEVTDEEPTAAGA